MAMASSRISPFIYAFFLLFFASHIRASKTGSDPIKRVCKSTPYYALCVATLRSDPTAAASDARGLAAIMLNAAAANATAVSAYLSSQLISGAPATGGGPAPAQAVMRLCADKYSSAGDSLQAALQDLAMEMYDYAGVDAAAAAAYPDACRSAFRRAPAVAYPAELARKEANLKRMCAVAVAIIDQLVNQQK